MLYHSYNLINHSEGFVFLGLSMLALRSNVSVTWRHSMYITIKLHFTKKIKMQWYSAWNIFGHYIIITHILARHIKMMRYYGFLSNWKGGVVIYQRCIRRCGWWLAKKIWKKSSLFFWNNSCVKIRTNELYMATDGYFSTIILWETSNTELLSERMHKIGKWWLLS